MPTRINTGTRDIPLLFAKELSAIVNHAWIDGSFMTKANPVTQDLLRFWFEPPFTEERTINFHEGQKQAILNTIYLHEILQSDSVSEMYAAISSDTNNHFVDGEFLSTIQNDKNAHPKYCIKMATGTGKTWVLNALLIWQYLNAKYSPPDTNVKFTKNFLLVAPGLIVYERLLDAFLGKQQESGIRNFATSDIKANEALFLPDPYRDDIYSFIQNSVTEKTEIGHKITGDGIIAITNWHALQEEHEQEENDIDVAGVDLDDSKNIAKDILPLSPGISSGNALDTLDAKFLRGGILDYLTNLPDVCVFNDEAHHIHENKTYGVTTDVEWQKSLNRISAGKKRNFLQIDFSATPYDVTGSGDKRTKHFFPHIVVDFDLPTAMRSGLVKTFVMDRRKEIAALANDQLEFRATRDENKKVIELSNGQRLMLRAGLSKLKILEEQFTSLSAELVQNKYPKMLVVCENTSVSPLVMGFLKTEGLSDDDMMQIDSDRKGSIPTDEWTQVKQKLFSLDKQKQPKVVVSVLMLREGFDVSNVCVIVPLRSSEAPILLEQVLGRGLRLMWREPEYNEIKTENRRNIFELKKSPINYFDILSVIEHPAYEQFYEDLDKSLIGEETRETIDRESVLGDIVTAKLKDTYGDYDLFFPIIIKDKEEILKSEIISIDKLNAFSGWDLEQLKRMIPEDNAERFYSQEMSAMTRFGEYKVKGDIFTAQSYNDYLQKMMNAIMGNMAKGSANRNKTIMPVMQIDQTLLISAVDRFIRTKMFGQPFDPLEGNNWRILILSGTEIIQHVMMQLSIAIYEMQNSIDVNEAIVEKHYFSEVPSMIGRENYSLHIVKSIYDKTFYPSNKGGLEKKFLLECDADSNVERIIKINEHKHSFARFRYLRSDGMLSSYYPDFMVKIESNIYVVETKGADRASNPDVLSKKRGALDWIAKINELKSEDRMNCEWSYILLTDTNFNALFSKGADIKEILEYCKLTKGETEGTLF
jgi:type III restriction enzyme